MRMPSNPSGEYPKSGTISSHSDTEMRPREYSIDEGVWIEHEDSGKAIRLKDLCDIDSSGNIESIDRSDKRSVVHWVAGGNHPNLLLQMGRILRLSKAS